MYHRIMVVGHLGADPELRYTPAGQPVTSFSLAANRKDEGPLWFRVTCWDKLAETCGQYLGKGRLVLVEGFLLGDKLGNPRVWTTRDGTPRASFEVTGQAVKFLSSGHGESEPESDEQDDGELSF